MRRARPGAPRLSPTGGEPQRVERRCHRKNEAECEARRSRAGHGRPAVFRIEFRSSAEGGTLIARYDALPSVNSKSSKSRPWTSTSVKTGFGAPKPQPTTREPSIETRKLPIPLLLVVPLYCHATV